MSRRYYSSTAQRTTLSSPITSTATSVTVTALVGYPSTFPYTIILDADTVNEEVCTVTAAAGTTLTIIRGVDGTVGVAHAASATLQHGVSARDFNEVNQFLYEGGTADGNGVTLDWDLYSHIDAADSASSFNMSRSHGTTAAPTAIGSADAIGYLDWNAWDGTAMELPAARIAARTDGTVSSGIVPTRLEFWTENASGVFARKMAIDKDGLILGAGTSLGAWTTYTPVLAGSAGWVLGNATVSGRYMQIGKVVVCRFMLTFGTTSTFGSGSGSVTVSLPVTANHNNSNITVNAFDASAAQYYVMPTRLSSALDSVNVNVMGASGAFTAPSPTLPFAWTSSDVLQGCVIYEAA